MPETSDAELPETAMPPNRAARRATVKTEKKARAATLDQMRKKKARVDEARIPSFDDAGEPVELVVRFRAIGSTAYDKLLAEHPPNKKQTDRGDQYNTDTFAPALIAACAYEPAMTYEDAAELYNSDEWSGGEITALFWSAQRVCQAGLDVPFSVSG